jgi:hypothetical protein
MSDDQGSNADEPVTVGNVEGQHVAWENLPKEPTRPSDFTEVGEVELQPSGLLNEFPKDGHEWPAGDVEPESFASVSTDADLNTNVIAAPSPALADASVEAQAQAAEEPADDAAPVAPAPWAGELINRLNCEETLPVLEDTIIAKLGSLALSNFEANELEVIRRGVYGRVFAAQKSRYAIVKSGQRHPFTGIDMDQKTVFLTPEELDAINNVTSYTKSLRVGFGFKIFEEDTWNNLPTNGDQKIAITANNPAKSNDPVMRIRGQLGLATEGNAVLWHSGMHLTLEGPPVLSQLRLETQLLDEKIEMARDSNGLVYSASSVYLNKAVADFILGFVTKSTIGTTNVEELKKVILLTDLEPLTLAAAATIFPDGYNLDRPCLTTHGGCGETLTRKVNLRRMLFVRRSRIDENQFALMAKRSARVDIKTVKAYQESIRPEVSRYIDISPTLKVKMRVPTLADYERQATAWMDEMDNRARVLMTSYANEADRQTYLLRANNIAMVMAYSHWIEAVVKVDENAENGLVTELTRVLQGDEANDLELQYKADQDLDRLLESFADDGELTAKIAEAIEKFINAMTLATVAVPKSACPSCGVPLTGDSLSKHPHLVSINPIEVFFTLIHHKIKRAGG